MKATGRIWTVAYCLSLFMALTLLTSDYVWAPVRYKLGAGDTIDFTAVTKANQGSGSSLDADMLDGKEGSEYLTGSSSTENTFTIGDGNNTDKYYQFNKGGSNLPGIRWNASGGKVQLSHDGTSYQDIGTSPITEEGDTQKVANTATIDFNAADFVITESPTNEANIALEDAVRFSGKTTDDLTEGSTNLYHTDARFDTRLGTKTTDDLAEGSTNKYNPFGTAIDTGEITDGTIADGDVSGTAAITESKLNLNYATHSNTNDPTADEKAALAGTSGTPSTTNKYVTDADARMADSRPPSGSAGGDLSGTYPNPAVVDDSHAHIITNIDSFTKTALETQLSDVADLAEADGDVYTGAHDFGGATSVEIPNSATPATDAAGEVALDTTITDHKALLQYYTGTENMIVPAIPIADLVSTDNYIIKYDAANDKFTMEADAGGAFSSRARATRTTTQTLTTGVSTQITFTAESYDNDSEFASSQFTVTTAGGYLVTAMVRFADNGTGVRSAQIYLNGSPMSPQAKSETPSVSGDTMALVVAVEAEFSASDTIRLYGLHTRGSDLNVDQAWLAVSRRW